jgi:predicted HicB family RNase H-like nuclease
VGSLPRAGDTAKALAGVEKLVAEVVRDMHARGEAWPKRIATRTFSGSFKVRIPPDLHRKLALEAAENAVSLNRLVSMKLAG